LYEIFHHKDLGNHLLQLCPKVMKHPVYPCLQDNTLHCCNYSLTLLKMGRWLPKTCWADSKINKIVIVASSRLFILFTYIDDAQSNRNQT